MPYAGKLVAFASLWLGIVAGTVPVELLVPPETARLEVLLDGRPAGALTGPPWSLPVDLGAEIAPHELIAVATDAAGNELGRARQWLNLPRPAAVLEVTVEATPEAGGVARVAWGALAGAAPLAVRARLDERPLPVADPSAVPLPPYDAEVPHLLRVEADFPGGVAASRELVLGGALAEEMSFELTGVPVLLAQRRARGEEIEVFAGDRPLPPLAVEKGPADLVVVIDPAARSQLVAMTRELRRMTTAPGGIRAMPTRVDARFFAPLAADVRLRVLWPVASRHARQDVTFELFTPGPERRARDGGLLFHLLRAEAPESAAAPRLADAVAVAGLAAAQEARRRGVLLVLGPEPRDASHYSAAAVRRYLERMRVPLAVWSTGGKRRGAKAFAPGEAPGAWGETERVSNLAGLEQATKRLGGLLDRQRIVWVPGAHLPQALTASPGLQGEGGEAVKAAADVAEAAGEAAAAAEEAEQTAGTAAGEVAGEKTGEEADEDIDEAPGEEAGEAAGGDAGEAIAETAAPGLVPAAVPAAAERPSGLAAAFATVPFGPFVLYTDLREQATVTTLQRVATALPAAWSERFGLPLPDPLAGTLVVFAREDDFRAFAAASGDAIDRGVRGSTRGGRVALAAAGQPPDELAALFVHELAHLLAARAFGRELPPWLEEGLAEELALARLTRSGKLLPGTLRGRVRARTLDAIPQRPTFGNRFEVSADGAYGALSALLTAQRRGTAPALPALLALPQAEFARFEGRRERYTASAFFVRFLLDGRAQRARAPFQAFLAAVAGGGPADAGALVAALGEPLPLLERDFTAWLRLQATANR
jgi:hypothetical protein